jgi:hypothetical protein
VLLLLLLLMRLRRRQAVLASSREICRNCEACALTWNDGGTNIKASE